MKPSSSTSNTGLPLSALALQLNLKHPLVQLAETIEWPSFEEKFGRAVKASGGRPALPTRLMVGLHYLKALYDESDESVVSKWVENPYWQYFCGEQVFQHSNSKFQHTDINVSAKVEGEPRWGEAGECYDVSRLERRRRIAFFGGAGASMNASRAFQLSKYRYLVSAKISWKKPCRVPRMCRIA